MKKIIPEPKNMGEFMSYPVVKHKKYVYFCRDEFGKGETGYLPYFIVEPTKLNPMGVKEGPVFRSWAEAFIWLEEDKNVSL